MNKAKNLLDQLTEAKPKRKGGILDDAMMHFEDEFQQKLDDLTYELADNIDKEEIKSVLQELAEQDGKPMTKDQLKKMADKIAAELTKKLYSVHISL